MDLDDLDKNSSGYKLILVMDERIAAKFKEARQQNKDDIALATKLAMSPFNNRLSGIETQIANGNLASEKRLGEHSDNIHCALEALKVLQEANRVRKECECDAETKELKKKKLITLPVVGLILASSALTFIGQKVTMFIINGIATPPAVAAPKTPQP